MARLFAVSSSVTDYLTRWLTSSPVSQAAKAEGDEEEEPVRSKHAPVDDDDW